jgi:hypothetical protein
MHRRNFTNIRPSEGTAVKRDFIVAVVVVAAVAACTRSED